MSELLQQLSAAVRCDAQEARERAHVAICESKVKYQTGAEARAAVREIVRRGGNPTLKTYHCPFCLNWHLKRK